MTKRGRSSCRRGEQLLLPQMMMQQGMAMQQGMMPQGMMPQEQKMLSATPITLEEGPRDLERFRTEEVPCRTTEARDSRTREEALCSSTGESDGKELKRLSRKKERQRLYDQRRRATPEAKERMRLYRATAHGKEVRDYLTT